MRGPLLLLFVVGVPVGVATLAVVSRMRLRARLARRMRLAVGGAAGQATPGWTLAQGSTELGNRVGQLLAVLGRLMPLGEKDRDKIAGALRIAGRDGGTAVAIVLGAKLACLLVGIAIGFTVLPGFVSSTWGLGGLPGLLAALVGGMLLGVMLNLAPELVVTRLGAARRRRIEGAFGDAMDLLIVCLQAGMTFERAMRNTVANLRSFHPDLGGELGQVSVDMAVHGRTRQEALGRLAARLELPELRDFAVAVGQSERHGTPLVEALRRLAAATRVRMVVNMQASLARLPVLMVLPTMAFVLPGILVIVGGPAFVEFGLAMSEMGD